VTGAVEPPGDQSPLGPAAGLAEGRTLAAALRPAPAGNECSAGDDSVVVDSGPAVPAPPAAVTVLGVGNPIMGDDGIGPELLAAVQAVLQDPSVEFVDGGVGGLELLPTVQDARRLLILDAVAGEVPGEVCELTGDQIPRLLAAKLSPHQVGLLDVLTAARLLGQEPEAVAVVGIVPESVELGLGLAPVVAVSFPEAVARAVAVVEGWLAEESSENEGGRPPSDPPPRFARRVFHHHGGERGLLGSSPEQLTGAA